MPTNRRDGFGRSGVIWPCAGALIAAFVLFMGLWQAQPAGAAPAVSEHSVTADPDVVADSWSRQDLLSAKPAPMPTPPEASFDVPDFDAGVSASTGPFYPPDPTTLPERFQGKVFFDLGDNRYQCSGTLVSSRNGNVVYTAGHCVWDVETQQWVRNFVFIPGYSNGTSPFEAYVATTLSAPNGYTSAGNFSYDIGMATVDGDPQADLGGSRQIAFNLDPYRRKYTLYGYPAEPDPPYDGQTLVGCDSQVALRDAGIPQTMGVTPCDMRQGTSGGGWITDGNYLNSVTSYTYCETNSSLCELLWGPYFSNAAKSLYTSEAAGGSVAPTLKVKFSPPKVVRKRRVLFKFAGAGSTPVHFQCRLDSRSFSKCAARTLVVNLTAGRHVFRVRSADQTGHKSDKTIKKSFRVILKKKKQRR
ncbi:MAG: hypothetical protein JJE13_11335 [Thermoleophilia bacterium]|nr:hypothetical protein [Thermoleophilia bacterium]